MEEKLQKSRARGNSLCMRARIQAGLPLLSFLVREAEAVMSF
jgi:hypothetical protein